MIYILASSATKVKKADLHITEDIDITKVTGVNNKTTETTETNKDSKKEEETADRTTTTTKTSEESKCKSKENEKTETGSGDDKKVNILKKAENNSKVYGVSIVELRDNNNILFGPLKYF